MKNRILNLKKEHPDWGYKRIAKALGCAHNTVRYYLLPTAKEECLNRQRRNRRRNPKTILQRKIDQFLARGVYACGNGKVRKRKIPNNVIPFTASDLQTKVGATPRCYLTGKKLNMIDPKSFELDHIIPSCQGGSSTLDNCALAVRSANRAKHSLTLEEFLCLCKDVLNNYGYSIIKN